MKMKKISESCKIKSLIFMGTSDFAVPVFFKLLQSEFKPVLLITQPERRSGRRKKEENKLVTLAENANVPIFRPEDINSDESIDFVSKFTPNVIVTASYGNILKKRFRQIPQLGCLNIHPSLLPKYRGATPVNYPLFKGDKKTGVTIFLMKAKMDTGPIVAQVEYEIDNDDFYTKLQSELSEVGAKLLIDSLYKMQTDGLYGVSQEHEFATYTSKIEKADLVVDWKLPADKIINMVKGLSITPGAQTNFRDKILKILSVTYWDELSNEVPGTIIEVIKKKGIVVSVGNQETVLITSVQPSGKKTMSAFDFNLGARIISGERFKV